MVLFLVVSILVVLRGPRSGWARAAAIVVLFLSMVLSGAVAPLNHKYFMIPVYAFFGIILTYLSGLTVADRSLHVLVRSSFLVLMIGALGNFHPRLTLERLVKPARAGLSPALGATYLLRGQVPEIEPGGRQEDLARYPWKDYCGALEYVRRSTTPETPVASLLVECDTAVTSAIPRVSALPCDGIGCCFIPAYAMAGCRALEETKGCVVLWDPGVTTDPGLAEARWVSIKGMFDVVRENYHFEARFGNIEIWRHND